MSDEPKAPPGWYPRPEGGQRYWDGTQWTSHTAPDAGPPPDPLQAGSVSSGAFPAKRLSPAKFFGGILLAFLLVIGISSGLDSDSKDRASTDGGTEAVEDNGDELGAQTVCQSTFVPNELVGMTWITSDSADFGEETVTQDETNPKVWRVFGAVSGETVTGYKISGWYGCKVAHKSGDTYRVIDVIASFNKQAVREELAK